MASVGSELINPETGWKRLDDRDSNIVYGNGWAQGSDASYQSGTFSSTFGFTPVKFSFYGAKLRIISCLYDQRTPNAKIKIDGQVYNVLQYNTSLVFKAICFEVLNLPLGTHIVEYYKESGTDDKMIMLDAIDIDDTGYFLHPTLETVTKLRDLTLGKCIRAFYQGDYLQLGAVCNIGKATADLLNPVLGDTGAKGDLYFICVEDTGSAKKLIADRNVQSTLTYKQIESGFAANNNTLAIATLDDVTPIMTSKNTPNPYVVTESSSWQSNDNSYRYSAWCAFDGSDETTGNYESIWLIQPSPPQWLKIDMGNPIKIDYVALKPGVGYNNTPTDFKIEGSNDNSTFDVLVSVTGQDSGWVQTQYKMYEIAESFGAYRYYRLTITKGNTSYLGIGRIRFFKKSEQLIQNGPAKERCLTENEWLNIISTSTLGGKITAKDDAIWHWKTRFMWTSTVATGSNNRIVGYGDNMDQNYDVNGKNYTIGYRPVIDVAITVELSMSKILLMDNDTVYTIENNALKSLGALPQDSADIKALFKTNGIDTNSFSISDAILNQALSTEAQLKIIVYKTT